MFVKVPLDWELPTRFTDSVRERLEAPNEWKKSVCPHITSVNLTQSEQLTVEYFKKVPKEGRPLNWLPHAEAIMQDEYLSQAGMIPALSRGMVQLINQSLSLNTVVDIYNVRICISL